MRLFWIQLLRVVHVLGAIAAVGPTLVYGMWQTRGERAGGRQLAFALHTTKWVDDRFATPALWSQVVTGVALAWLRERSILGTAWILSALLLFTLLVVLATIGYLPANRKQIAAADRLAEGPDPSAEAGYRSARRSASIWGTAVFAVTITIVVLMVVQPKLWSAG